jgi:lysyl endopeptidase
MTFRLPRVSVLVLFGLCASAHAAQSIDTYNVDLNPLIDKAQAHPSQFAVDVARRITSESSGSWTVDQNNAIWNYSIRIPTAVSMAFHASSLRLPADGILSITAGGQTYSYRGSELHRSDFWSRIAKGDQIALRIVVLKSKRQQTLLEIASFQAGYKSLVRGGEDNAHFKEIKARTSASSSGCIENYVCDATSATQSAANSSVALTISNTFECSGTLVNDVPQDGKPYVLTARHCQNGADGGGDPAAASSVQIYWNAVTPCGQILTSIFDASAQTQYGATTVVEQQDAWLIRMDTPPAAADAYYSGWDASGNAPVGGYSIHYANNDTQQYVTWAGTAVSQSQSGASLNLGYSSTFWGVVNSLGSVDPGASGSALFTNNNQITGTLSRAVVAQCPVTPPPPPSASTQVALYIQLAAVWTSTADTTSTTGSVTLASVLDPANTGATTMTGIAGPPPTVSISPSQGAAQVGTPISLEFQFALGAICTASGGLAGDGWTGTIGPSLNGDLSITENTPGTVTYGLTCTAGSRTATSQVAVIWSLAPPALTFTDLHSPYVGVASTLIWTSNQSSCTATGGSSGDGWTGTLPGSGQAAVTESQPGTYTYTITCGAGSQATSQSLVRSFLAPTAAISLLFSPPPALRVGQMIALNWTGNGGCTASGGASGDHWSGPVAGFGIQSVTETTAGTYTYTISCGPTAIAAVAQVSYTFTSAPPSAALTAAQPTQLINLTNFAFPTLLSWTANVAPCTISYTGPASGDVVDGYPAAGTSNQAQQIAGLYTYKLTCGSGTATATSTATITWTQPSPQVALSAVGTEFILPGGYLNWTTNVLPCVASGGTTGDGWNGPLTYQGLSPSLSGSTPVSESTPGTYLYTITCGVGVKGTAQASVVFNNVGGSQLSFATSNVFSTYANQPIHLSWNSALTPCMGFGGSTTDGWNTAHPAQSSIDLSESLGSQNYTYSLVCGSGAQAVEAQVQIYVNPATDVAIAWERAQATAAVGHPETLGWTASEAASCVASGGVSGDGWSGVQPFIGSVSVTEQTTGTVNYTLTCQNDTLTTQSVWTTQWVPAPTVTLTSSEQQATFGVPFSLTWSSTGIDIGFCNATEDGQMNSAWFGPLQSAGSVQIQESSGATHTYMLDCQGTLANAQAQVTVNFAAPPSQPTPPTPPSSPTPPASSSGGGGGGGLDSGLLEFLALLTALRLLRHAGAHRQARNT